MERDYIHDSAADIAHLTNLELLQLAAQGQETLTEGTIGSPLLYRLLGQRGLLGSEL